MMVAEGMHLCRDRGLWGRHHALVQRYAGGGKALAATAGDLAAASIADRCHTGAHDCGATQGEPLATTGGAQLELELRVEKLN